MSTLMSLLQRLHDFLLKPVVEPSVADMYRRCVEQARSIDFYQALGVPDTIDGRFDLLLLHVFIVMQRLDTEAIVKQKLFDLMFSDMDRSLREMGVGDMSISRKIKPMISAFYGRGQAYQKALADSDDVLAQSLGRNLYGSTQVNPDVLQQMASYVRQTVASLDAQPLEDIVAGKVKFVAPV
jgi:cytochrome b pre-mRNA-processing protein 3